MHRSSFKMSIFVVTQKQFFFFSLSLADSNQIYMNLGLIRRVDIRKCNPFPLSDSNYVPQSTPYYLLLNFFRSEIFSSGREGGGSLIFIFPCN